MKLLTSCWTEFFLLLVLLARFSRCCTLCHCEYYDHTVTVRCQSLSITEVPQNLPLNVTYLHLEGTSITTIKSSDLWKYKQLVHLYIKKNSLLSNIEGDVFQFTTKLSILSITENVRLSSLHPDTFKASMNLRDLNLKGNALDDFPQLSEMNFNGTTMPYKLTMDENPLTKPKNLMCRRAGSDACKFRMMLRSTQMEKLPAYIFANASISSLDMSDNSLLKEIDEDAFMRMRKSPEHLFLTNNPLLANLPYKGLEDLTILNFQRCPSLKTIPPTVKFTKIQKVDLTFSQHCCAFHNPKVQDPISYKQVLEKYKCDKTAASTTPVVQRYGRSLLQFGDYYYGADDDLPITTTDFTPPVFNLDPDATINPNIDHEIVPTFPCDSFSKEEYRKNIQCSPAEDAFRPCGDIFESSHWLRSLLWIVALSAMLGNSAVLTFTILSKTKTHMPMTVTKFLICNLAFADLVLSIYLLSVAITDVRSMGQYFNFATSWELDGGCELVGFLAVFAAELSVFTLSVITVERWYAISHAIHLTKRVQMKQAVIIMVVGWVFAITLALLPLRFIGFSDYRVTSICLPFKFDELKDQIYVYSLLGFNCLAFTVVMFCYVSIFFQVRGSNASMASDAYLAKRMAILVFTDLFCWAPVAVVAGMAIGGLDITSALDPALSVNSLYIAKVVLVIFFPFNSCANPFLYAIITKQFQRDCILTLNSCGLCEARAKRLKNPTPIGFDSVSRQHHLRSSMMSNTTQCTTQCTLVTASTGEGRFAAHRCLSGESHRHGSNSLSTHSDYALRECALKALSSKSLQNASNGRRQQKLKPTGTSVETGLLSLSSISTLDDLSRRPSETIRVPETLVEGDSVSYTDQWQGDTDSGTDIPRQISESDAESRVPQQDSDSEGESGYRGQNRSPYDSSEDDKKINRLSSFDEAESSKQAQDAVNNNTQHKPASEEHIDSPVRGKLRQGELVCGRPEEHELQISLTASIHS